MSDKREMLATEEGREELAQEMLLVVAPALRLLAIHTLVAGADPAMTEDETNEHANYHLQAIGTPVIAGCMTFAGIDAEDVPGEHVAAFTPVVAKLFAETTQGYMRKIVDGESL